MSLQECIELLRGKRLFVLTGAGLSTGSGIPDYRTPGRERRRPPIQHKAFVGDELVRRRYWSRSALGWPRFRSATPNAGHLAVTALQQAGVVTGLVTQNVDRLHAKAESQAIELHGALAQVRCLSCGAIDCRDEVQERILDANPSALEWSHSLLPDGDADIPDEAIADFCVPACLVCRGILKPDVVFFGDAVPPARVQAAMDALDAAEALLVLGSSLEVFSGYRFVLRAVEQSMPVALVTLGSTRADAVATVRWQAELCDALPRLAEALEPRVEVAAEGAR